MDRGQGCPTVLVPRDLLVELDAYNASSRVKRLLVSGWVFCSPDLIDRDTLRSIIALWPPNALGDMRRTSVLDVLFQLEEWGFVKVKGEQGEFIEVERLAELPVGGAS